MYEGRFDLREDQVRFYEENGYIQLLDVLTPEEVVTLRDAMDIAAADRKRLQENWGPRSDDGYSKVFLQMVNVWERYPAIEEYTLNPRVAGIARQLTRSPFVRLWHDHALIKYPNDSKATAWHQDKVYWPMHESRALSCWMALDDVTVRKGCMSGGSRCCRRGEPPACSARFHEGSASGRDGDESGELHVSPRFDISLCRAQCHRWATPCDGDNLYACRHPLHEAGAPGGRQGKSQGGGGVSRTAVSGGRTVANDASVSGVPSSKFSIGCFRDSYDGIFLWLQQLPHS
jgi:hypothetical protein